MKIQPRFVLIRGGLKMIRNNFAVRIMIGVIVAAFVAAPPAVLGKTAQSSGSG